MSEKTAGDGRIQSVQTAFRIAEQLVELDGAGVTELTENVDVTKSTVYDHLSTLQEMGYAIKERDEYNLSLRFLRFGRYVRYRKKLYETVEEDVKEVADETEQRTQFIAREGSLGIPLVYASGKKGMPYIGFNIGEPLSLHATAAGKAIFANLPEEDIEEIFETPFETITENTITEPHALRGELETVRQQGYSVNREESFSGLRAVGVPIRDEDGTVVGALSVAGPANRLRGAFFEDELPQLLKGYANEVELKIKHL
jgi:DNA-binding IclR family transcriptional regulator